MLQNQNLELAQVMLQPHAKGSVTLMQGNRACAEAALAANMRFFAGYPITPSSEIADFLSTALPEKGGIFIQMEDEIASMAAVIGASLAGAKAMTATSGPGFTLMQELIGYAALCEIPCVIVNVQRGGPSTGLPTSPAQGDVMQCKWGSHGDYPIIVLAPSSVSETFDLTIRAFNLSEALRTPVILLSDEIVGHLYEKIMLPQRDDLRLAARRAPSEPMPGSYRPYAVRNPREVPIIPDLGTGFHFHATGLIHDEEGFPTRDPQQAAALITRLHEKINCRKREICQVEKRRVDDAAVLLCSFGATARSCFQVVKDAREQGEKIGGINIKTLWPFPDFVFRELPPGVETIVVCEMNQGQIIGEVERAVCGRIKVKAVNDSSGTMMAPGEISSAVFKS